MTTVWFPRLDEIKGDDEIKEGWEKLRENISKKRYIKMKPQGSNGLEFPVPIDLIIVIQQYNCWRKAIVLEEMDYKKCTGFLDTVKKAIPEADGAKEVRISYYMYSCEQKKWIFQRNPVHITIEDFYRLFNVYNAIKNGNEKHAIENGLEKL